MAKKRIKYIKRGFESDGRSDDVSANIYFSMITHSKFIQLTGRQLKLYLVCKLQYYKQSKHPIDSAGNTDSSYFYMNRELWQNVYQLYSPNTQRHFYTDMQALIDLGFIELVESGKFSRTKNIYKLSDKWQR